AAFPRSIAASLSISPERMEQRNRARLQPFQGFSIPEGYSPIIHNRRDANNRQAGIQPRAQLFLRGLPRAAPIPHTTLALSSHVLVTNTSGVNYDTMFARA